MGSQRTWHEGLKATCGLHRTGRRYNCICPSAWSARWSVDLGRGSISVAMPGTIQGLRPAPSFDFSRDVQAGAVCVHHTARPWPDHRAARTIELGVAFEGVPSPKVPGATRATRMPEHCRSGKTHADIYPASACRRPAPRPPPSQERRITHRGPYEPDSAEFLDIRGTRPSWDTRHRGLFVRRTGSAASKGRRVDTSGGPTPRAPGPQSAICHETGDCRTSLRRQVAACGQWMQASLPISL